MGGSGDNNAVVVVIPVDLINIHRVSSSGGGGGNMLADKRPILRYYTGANPAGKTTNSMTAEIRSMRMISGWYYEPLTVLSSMNI